MTGDAPGAAPPTVAPPRPPRPPRPQGPAGAVSDRRRLRRRNTGIAVAFAVLLCLVAGVSAVGALRDVGPVGISPDRTPDTAEASIPAAAAPAVDGAAASPPPATPTPAPAPPAPLAFSSPTGNIGCLMAPDGVRCDIVDRGWEPGPAPADCAGDWGAGVQVGPQGAGLVCATDTVLGSADALQYGAVAEVGTFRCTSTQAGMRCEDLTAGRGFSLARTGYTLF